MHSEREIDVKYLARVEGEGAMYLKLEGEEVVDLKFKIFEPPRFYEAFLQGRRFSEAPDITARICGICPIAYQTSSINAMEHAAGTTVPHVLQELRRLIYCGEWIESHSLHIFFLHAPDFLGYESGLAMAEKFPQKVEDALRLKKLGNTLMTVLGGREIHPINTKVGGFYRVPTREELEALVPELEWGLEASIATTRWVSGLQFPDFERDYEFVAMHHPDEYAIHQGRIVSSRGIDIAVEEWSNVFTEEHVEWSNALHARIKNRGSYHVGPMARYTINHQQLTPLAHKEAERSGLGVSCTNPFKSIVVRAIELVFAFEEALRIISEYVRPAEPAVPVDPAGKTGHGASEAPRGLLYHSYSIDDEGLISHAQIVPPTSQNQLSIEEDLREYVPGRTHLSDDVLQWQLEQAIRNYDPCISCATHFLDLEVDRA
ncbi:MAG: Ni/Fe hydrogenase subunit alpha [Actinomycetota bacterium]|nr:Ni/Fe hydrogenase subunit alpha [Actinomycetota bacterium]